jgi:Ca-activated chloride channel family protein
MTFREPLLLLGLLLVPLAVVAYVAAQRRRRRYAVRYPNLDVLAAVAARGWTRHLRHLPAALALLALGALVVALARPQRTVASEIRQGTVVMVTDTSSSMRATDVRPTRLDAGKAAARDLLRSLPEDFRLGLVSFSSVADLQAAPSTDRQPVLTALARLNVRGATAMGDGMALGLRTASQPVDDGFGRPRRLPAALILLSDGESTRGRNDPLQVAQQARRARVPIYTVALGTATGVLETRDKSGAIHREPVPPDVETLQQIARVTGGRFFAAADARRLRSIYANLGRGLARKREKREVTSAFAGGALALLLAGGLLGLVRTGRLP